MPSLSVTREEFDDRLKNNWGSTTPIAWDNDNSYDEGSVPWIRAVLVPSYSENADLQGLKRHYGIYIISIFVPLNSGSGDAYTYADQVKSYFENQTFNEITCYAADVRRIGDDGHGWYMLNVLINFWTDE